MNNSAITIAKPEVRVRMCGYSYHAQPFYTEERPGLSTYLFRIQTEGHAHALVGGEMCPIGPGDLLLYSPGEMYRLQVSEVEHPTRGSVLMSGDYYLACDGSWVDQWWSRRPPQQLIRMADDEKLLALWRLLLLEKRRLEAENEELTVSLLKSLCLSFDRLAGETRSTPGKPFIASRMKSFIEEHATTAFKIEDLANHIGLSESRTAHLFKEWHGVTVIEYVHEVRLAIAEERIRYSSLTLEHIAESCGFRSYSYFFRVFRRKFGLSPADYRQQAKL
ncbi:helix-turn-helix domain-containing protein [Paenibacillus daejeonensis]|uniref:helix-turn-helix domain-containing protein n=1 Tax=Paenibacillus daejeonensis TaxID=135193 RepID=UPI00036F5038|nr:AraC family transcriptional regulator [Paenibacillus daejeonensis]